MGWLRTVNCRSYNLICSETPREDGEEEEQGPPTVSEGLAPAPCMRSCYILCPFKSQALQGAVDGRAATWELGCIRAPVSCPLLIKKFLSHHQLMPFVLFPS